MQHFLLYVPVTCKIPMSFISLYFDSNSCLLSRRIMISLWQDVRKSYKNFEILYYYDLLRSDNDECAEHNGGCDQRCITQGAWYRCECDKGFSLDKNGYSCRGTAITRLKYFAIMAQEKLGALG